MTKIETHDPGPRRVLNAVIFEAIVREGVDTDVVHADTTTKSLHGQYEQDGDWIDVGSFAQREDALS